MATCGNLIELPPALLQLCLLPLNARSIAALACTCRALASASLDAELWRHIFSRKWDAPRTPFNPRAEHIARKRLLALVRQQAPQGDPLARVMHCAPVAQALYRLCTDSARFTRSRKALEHAGVVPWLLAAASACSHCMMALQARGRVPDTTALADACAWICAALGAAVVRVDEHAAAVRFGDAQTGEELGRSIQRVAVVLAARAGGEAAAALCASAALASAPLAVAPLLPAAARAPAAGAWPAAARPPHDSVAARVRREARADASCTLLTGSWAGVRVQPARDAPEAQPEPVELRLRLNASPGGHVSGWGEDACGTFDAVGRVRSSAPPGAPLHSRLSLRVTYRDCGGLPGPLIEHAVPGAAPSAWELCVWPFGLAGAWAPEASPAAGGHVLWLQGGTLLLWPHAR